MFKQLVKFGLMCWALLFAAHANAATVSYQAISDFPVTDAGEVPYYVDQARQALAINAAIVEYRDRFAKATVVFDGQPGIYQLTLVAIAELDGEAEYRLSVNGETVGEVSNPEVDEEFVVVRHQFVDVNLPAGAIIAVESLANSNGKIPENDETAFARGRWMMLDLSNSEESVSDPDLAIVANVTDENPLVGDEIEIALSISNAPNSEVATGVVVSISIPDEALEPIDQTACNSSQGILQCRLAELPAESSVDITISLRAIAELANAPIELSVSSDQTDLDGADNSVGLLLTVGDALIEGSDGEGTDENSASESEVVEVSASPENGTAGTDSSNEDARAGEGTTMVSGSSSSGGAPSIALLLSLAAGLGFRYKQGSKVSV